MEGGETLQQRLKSTHAQRTVEKHVYTLEIYNFLFQLPSELVDDRVQLWRPKTPRVASPKFTSLGKYRDAHVINKEVRYQTRPPKTSKSLRRTRLHSRGELRGWYFAFRTPCVLVFGSLHGAGFLPSVRLVCFFFVFAGL